MDTRGRPTRRINRLCRTVLSYNCENERTKVLYMKVKTTFSLKVESIMGLNGEVDRIGLSHGEAV